MKISQLIAIITLFVCLSVFTSVSAQTWDWQGTGDNSGRGWRPDGSGGLRGTGDNSGRGWRRNR